jgi:hypothetical protein
MTVRRARRYLGPPLSRFGPGEQRLEFRWLRKGLHARIEKPDFERAIGDRASLSDELIEPLLIDDTVSGSIHICAVVFVRRCAVDCHAEPYRLPTGRRPQHQVHIEGKVWRVHADHHKPLVPVILCPGTDGRPLRRNG